MKSEYPGVAQLVARLNGVQEAASSNLVTRTESFRNLTLCQVSEIFYFKTSLKSHKKLDTYAQYMYNIIYKSKNLL